MLACESVVCQDKKVETIGLDKTSSRIVVVSPDGLLFMADNPKKTLELSQAARSIPARQGQAEEIEAGDKLVWTAVGCHGGKILAAGHNKTKKRLEYLLVEAATMAATDRLTMAEQVGDKGVNFVQLTTVDGRLVAVCCRYEQHVDILRVVGDRLEASSKNQAIDVCGDSSICSVSRHGGKANVFLVGGYQWLKKLQLKSV